MTGGGPARQDDPARLVAAIGRSPWRIVRRTAAAVELRRADGGRALSAAGTVLDALGREGHLAVTDGTVRATADGLAAVRRARSGEGLPQGSPALPDPVVRCDADAAAGFNAMESPLAWLASRRDRNGRPMISAAEFEAGRRLHADYERTGLRQRVTASWDPTVTAGRGERSRPAHAVADTAIDARRRLEAALAAVGTDLAPVLFAVCCEETGLEAVERRHGWPKRTGKVVLGIALRRLASHYGITGEAVGRDRRPGARIEHWGTADYRPTAG